MQEYPRGLRKRAAFGSALSPHRHDIDGLRINQPHDVRCPGLHRVLALLGIIVPLVHADDPPEVPLVWFSAFSTTCTGTPSRAQPLAKVRRRSWGRHGNSAVPRY